MFAYMTHNVNTLPLQCCHLAFRLMPSCLPLHNKEQQQEKQEKQMKESHSESQNPSASLGRLSSCPFSVSHLEKVSRSFPV